eukprot:3086622-Karenia_brevis.AAC.1
MQLEIRAVEIRTDSAYVLNGVSKHLQQWRRNGWKRRGRPISNSDVWQQVDKLLLKRSPSSYR